MASSLSVSHIVTNQSEINLAHHFDLTRPDDSLLVADLTDINSPVEIPINC